MSIPRPTASAAFEAGAESEPEGTAEASSPATSDANAGAAGEAGGKVRKPGGKRFKNSDERFLGITEKAQQDLCVMVSYLTRADLKGAITCEKVSEAATLCGRDVRSLSDEERGRIWILVQEFSPHLGAVSVDDLRRAEADPQGSPKRVYISTGAGIGILVALLATLLMQIYAILGTRSLNLIEQTNRDRMDVVESINTMENANPSLGDPPRKRAELLALSAPYVHLRDHYDALNTKLCYAYHGLYQWNATWGTAVAWANLTSPVRYWNFENECGAEKAACEWRGDELVCEPGGRSRIQVRYGTEVMARSVLDALQSLILPALFAMLGACIRLLRTRLQQYQDRKVSTPQPWETRVRVLVGTVVGSVLGFFYTPGVVGGQLASIPLLGLAFLVGYNVEILFMFFDKMTGWLRGKMSGDGDSSGERRSSSAES